MRLDTTAARRRSATGGVRFALFVAALILTLPVSAQLSGIPQQGSKKVAMASGSGKGNVADAELKLLGGPSDFDKNYLRRFGGPPDDSADPSQTMAEDPRTPTELLVAKTGRSDSATGAEAAGSNAATYRPKWSGAEASSSVTELVKGGLASRGLAASPYGSPAGSTTVYRSPW